MQSGCLCRRRSGAKTRALCQAESRRIPRGVLLLCRVEPSGLLRRGLGGQGWSSEATRSVQLWDLDQVWA